MLVLGRNSGRNRLVAFEAAGWIEVFTLLAGVQVEAALRALADGIGEILEQGATFGAAGDGARSRHVDGPRPERILSFRGRRFVELLFRSPAGILVSVLPVLTIRQKVPPAKRPILRLWQAPHKRFFRVASGEPGVLTRLDWPEARPATVTRGL